MDGWIERKRMEEMGCTKGRVMDGWNRCMDVWFSSQNPSYLSDHNDNALQFLQNHE